MRSWRSGPAEMVTGRLYAISYALRRQITASSSDYNGADSDPKSTSATPQPPVAIRIPVRLQELRFKGFDSEAGPLLAIQHQEPDATNVAFKTAREPH
jgi:hypothetical protein